MATTPPPPSSSSPDPATAPPIAVGAQPQRPYPPLFSAAQPLLGKPVNHPPPASAVQPVVFPIPRGIPFRSRPHAADQTVTVSGSAGYVRGAAQTPVVAFAAGSGRAPFVFSADQAAQRPPPATAVHVMRPPQPQFVVPRQVRAPAPPVMVTGVPKSSPVVSGTPKVGSFLAASTNPEVINTKEREKSREDSLAVIHGRKVRLLDAGSGSLYALCRSWVRNGLPQEFQSSFGCAMKLLPRPLPAANDASVLKRTEEECETEDSAKEEHANSVDHLSPRDLLQVHIKRAKRIRARLKKERVMRIDRYKQRLALLLPVPPELGRINANNGS